MKRSRSKSPVKFEVPAPLYRAFHDPWFAHCFVEHGEISLGRLDHYRGVEDLAARDPDEATSQYRIPLNVLGDSRSADRISFNMEVGHPIYILCTSGPLVDLGFLRHEHGANVVRIDDPVRLATEIERHLTRGGKLKNRRLGWVKVSYDRGTDSDHDPTDAHELYRACSQKAPRFSADCEYRLVYEMLADTSGATRRESVAERQPVTLGGRLSYCECLPNNALQRTHSRVTSRAGKAHGPRHAARR